LIVKWQIAVLTNKVGNSSTLAGDTLPYCFCGVMLSQCAPLTAALIYKQILAMLELIYLAQLDWAAITYILYTTLVPKFGDNF
jgi:hypothetical protein